MSKHLIGYETLDPGFKVYNVYYWINNKWDYFDCIGEESFQREIKNAIYIWELKK